MNSIPQHYRLEFNQESIQAAVERIGEEITPWARQVFEQSGKDVVAVPILRGGVFFFCDLVRQIDFSVEVAPIRSWGYVTGENEKQTDQLDVRLDDLKPEGRAILLVDDICDSGRSLNVISERLRSEGAVDVRSAVLLRRDTPQNSFRPDWVGFEYSSDEWFVGYGMDDADRFRNLSSVFVIEQDAK